MASGRALAGQTCFITGAGRGIGEAIAQSLAKQGAQLILTARSRDQLEQVAQACRSHGAANCEAHVVDLADSAAIDAVAASVLEKYGCIDVLINNAGMATEGDDPLTGDPDAWERMIRVNMLAPMRLTRRFAPGMVAKGAGAIINIASVAGVEPVGGVPGYAASKHGLRGWSLSVHENLRKHGIKSVSINPGAVDTPMAANVKGKHENMIRPEDVAQAVMLAINTSLTCVPTDITLRPVRPVW